MRAPNCNLALLEGMLKKSHCNSFAIDIGLFIAEKDKAKIAAFLFAIEKFMQLEWIAKQNSTTES
jgi:hypothetical protein